MGACVCVGAPVCVCVGASVILYICVVMTIWDVYAELIVCIGMFSRYLTKLLVGPAHRC